MTLSKMAGFCVAAAFIIAFTGLALAAPPIPPPPEGFGISTYTDVVVEGDFVHTSSLNWTWMYDTDPNGGSTLAHGATRQALAAGGRAAQILYSNEVNAIDGFVQFNKTFEFGSESEPNLDVRKDFGYIASEGSMIASARDVERIGLSMVAYGDSGGLGSMPSLCPWAAGTTIPATNEFIAMGSATSTRSWMISHTDSDVTGTGPPSLNYSITAEGVGVVTTDMIARVMEGGGIFVPGEAVPNLISQSDYEDHTEARGVISEFRKELHYHSTIPEWQMPEPWYEIQ